GFFSFCATSFLPPAGGGGGGGGGGATARSTPLDGTSRSGAAHISLKTTTPSTATCAMTAAMRTGMTQAGILRFLNSSKFSNMGGISSYGCSLLDEARQLPLGWFAEPDGEPDGAGAPPPVPPVAGAG